MNIKCPPTERKLITRNAASVVANLLIGLIFMKIHISLEYSDLVS